MKSKSLEEALAELEAKRAQTAEYLAKHAPEIEAATAMQNALNAQLAALPQQERRQVLYAAGLKHISAAPPPIEPIRSSYTQPRTPAALPDIDWRYWRHMPEVKQWEACALSLNINPDNMKHHPQAWMAGPGSGPIFTDASFPNKAGQIEFDKRVRLLGANLFSSGYFTAVNNLVRGGRHLATLNLREFAAWALHVELEGMPPELVEMAETKAAPTLMPEPQATTPSPAPVVADGASDGVEPDKAGPLPVEQGLSTKDVAHAFDGVNGWSVDRWTKNLSAAKWLHPARIALGGAGGASSVWSPVLLAQLMHDSTKSEREKERLMKVFNSRFTRNPALGLWRDAFNDYFATHCATD